MRKILVKKNKGPYRLCAVCETEEEKKQALDRLESKLEESATFNMCVINKEIKNDLARVYTVHPACVLFRDTVFTVQLL